jgi:type IV pilus assembly protein PilB
MRFHADRGGATMADPTKRLGDLLCEAQLVTRMQIGLALQEQRETNIRLGSALVQLGYLPEAKLAAYLSKMTGLPCVNVDACEVDDEALAAVPQAVAERLGVLPVQLLDGMLYVAAAEPLTPAMIDELKSHTGYQISELISPEFRLRSAIRRRYAAVAVVR